MANIFSKSNVWALDSTFKTKQWYILLYAAVVLNQDGKKMPIFYILCTKDKTKDMKAIL